MPCWQPCCSCCKKLFGRQLWATAVVSCTVSDFCVANRDPQHTGLTCRSRHRSCLCMCTYRLLSTVCCQALMKSFISRPTYTPSVRQRHMIHGTAQWHSCFSYRPIAAAAFAVLCHACFCFLTAAFCPSSLRFFLSTVAPPAPIFLGASLRPKLAARCPRCKLLTWNTCLTEKG